MKKSGHSSNIVLLILGLVFLVSLVGTVVFNNSTQKRIFWENQMDKLAVLAEKCVAEIDGWANLQTNIVGNVCGEFRSGRLANETEYIEFLTDVVNRNKEIQAAYLTLENGDSYISGDAKLSFKNDREYMAWYNRAIEADGAPIFTEPYYDVYTKDLVVSCLQTLVMPDGMVGVIGTDVSLADLCALVDALYPSPSKTGGAYLVSPAGRVMTYIDPSFLPRVVDGRVVFLTAEQVIAQTTTLEVIDKYLDRGIQIINIIDYDTLEKYEAITTVPSTGWMLGVNIPLADYAEAVATVVNNQIPLILLAVLMAVLSITAAFIMIANVRRQENLVKSIEVAQAASRTKSDFLSRMSHEMRTPMNAIIGMVKIADTTDDVGKLRYCLQTIETSSTHLLGIINDVLDMSKIEAGKFDLDRAPMNIEKILMKICNLIIDKTEQQNQKLEVVLGKNMGVHFEGDELRLSQVITNLLSNAVKFTPEQGIITLSVEETLREKAFSILRFSVKDNGIGMNEEQMGRLFTSFQQADSSITRRFGGTGLGLAISKTIVEKMGGRIWVESEEGKGSAFTFEVKLDRMPEQGGAKLYDGIAPSDIRVLIVDDDDEVRRHFMDVTEQFDIRTDEAESGEKALEIVANTAPYDVIFVDYDMPGMNGVETVRNLSALIDKNTVIIMTTFITWNKIEKEAVEAGVRQFIAKPLFPSSVLNAINEVVGRTLMQLDIKTDVDSDGAPDFSDIQMLLVEDVEINREIFAALMEETRINIDFAENGLEAVGAFKNDPDKYGLIIMDLQMPVMDGHEATRTIRELNIPRAKTIPIIAMTANVFREDIEKCMESGMNGHLAKPIDEKAVVAKIIEFVRK